MLILSGMQLGFGLLLGEMLMGGLALVPETQLSARASNALSNPAPIGWFEVSLVLPFAAVILLGDEWRRWLIRRDNRFVRRWLTW